MANVRVKRRVWCSMTNNMQKFLYFFKASSEQGRGRFAKGIFRVLNESTRIQVYLIFVWRRLEHASSQFQNTRRQHRVWKYNHKILRRFQPNLSNKSIDTHLGGRSRKYMDGNIKGNYEKNTLGVGLRQQWRYAPIKSFKRMEQYDQLRHGFLTSRGLHYG